MDGETGDDIPNLIEERIRIPVILERERSCGWVRHVTKLLHKYIRSIAQNYNKTT